MSKFVDTNVEPLVHLKNQLEIFTEKTEHMRLFANIELDDFEQRIDAYCSKMENIPGWAENSEEFYMLWNKYQNNRQIFQSQVDCLLRHEIMTKEGNRNLYSLICALEEYLRRLD